MHPANQGPLPVQEHAHLRNTVERIAEYKPSVLLVEKSVARYAQELLLKKGISLVLNVKRSSLLRLARCTESQVSTMLILQYTVMRPVAASSRK